MTHELELSLQFAGMGSPSGHRRAVTLARARRWVGLALAGPAEIAVRIVGQAEGRALNRQFRGKDYATNVLTFAYGEAVSYTHLDVYKRQDRLRNSLIRMSFGVAVAMSR